MIWQRRRIAALLLLLLLLLLLPLPLAGAEEATGAAVLPQGIWSLDAEGNWRFNTQAAVPLGPAQLMAAAEADLRVLDGTLPAGSSLTPAQLLVLYPGAEEALNLPLVVPQLEMFALDGTWSYDDGVLTYRHGEGYMPLTVDEVFAQLRGEDAPVSGEEKIVYLTIDDAPSAYTMELLATLDRLDVTATFFVVGAYVKQRPVFLRAIYDQGHAIANHSYSHNSRILGESEKSMLADFRRCEQAVNDALGFELPMPILRVPYGAGSVPVAHRTCLQNNGYLWIDWNALNGDTEDGIDSDQATLERAITTASRYDGSIVILVHDGKRRTIRTMEAMVAHFREQGYEFRPLTTNIEKIPGVRMGFPR